LGYLRRADGYFGRAHRSAIGTRAGRLFSGESR
jgi:hypothetical protein